MVWIEWRDEYRTGIDGVDHEHQELIGQINALYASLDAGSGRAELIDRLGDIYGSISAHFALEERTMRHYGYDCYEEHRDDHDRLLDDLRDLTDTVESGDAFDEDEFRRTLADWFQLHFSTHDARLHRMLDPESDDAAEPKGLQAMVKNVKHRLFGRG